MRALPTSPSLLCGYLFLSLVTVSALFNFTLAFNNCHLKCARRRCREASRRACGCVIAIEAFKRLRFCGSNVYLWERPQHEIKMLGKCAAIFAGPTAGVWLTDNKWVEMWFQHVRRRHPQHFGVEGLVWFIYLFIYLWFWGLIWITWWLFVNLSNFVRLLKSHFHFTKLGSEHSPPKKKNSNW